MMLRGGHALLLALLLAACGRSSEPLPKRLEKFVLDQPPADVGQKLNVGFDGRVTLLGARVDAPPQLSPGDRVRMKLYWRADARVDDDVRLSTHLLDGAGKRISDLDYAGPLRKRVHREQVLGPGRWTPGKIYVDEQSFRVPKTLKTQKLEVAVSLADGDDRLPIVQGKGDTQNRATIASFTVRPEKPKVRKKRPVSPASAPSASVPSSVASSAAAPPKPATPKPVAPKVTPPPAN